MTSPAPHDFSLLAQGINIRYCSRCAKPDLTANKRRPCVPLPPDVAKKRLARQMEMLSRLINGGGTR